MMRLLAICFLFLAAGAAASFQPLEEVVPTIGKTESDFSNGVTDQIDTVEHFQIKTV